MVAATYVSDLVLITAFDAITGVSAYGGGASGLGVGADYAIENALAVDKQVSAAEKGFLFAAGAAFTIGADDHFFIWAIVGTPGIADTRNNRGIVVGIGDSTTAFVKFHVNGSDTLPLGGLVPYAVRFDNTTLTNFRTLVGAPGTAPDNIGVGANITATAKFSNLGADVARIGTGYDILNGTGADPEANFAGIATDDESTSEGILQTTDGGFKLQGKLRIGSAATACEFLDLNGNIFAVEVLHALADFTEILIEHASSIFTLTNFNFIALGTGVASANKFRLEMLTSAATLTFLNVGFIDCADTVLGTGATLTGGRWIGCGQVIANGANLPGCAFTGYEGTADTSYLIWDTAADPNGELDGCSFDKGAAATHAIEFGLNSPLAITLTDVTFGSGYNAANANNDSTLHFKRTTGTIDLTISGGDTPSWRTDGATINLIAGAVTVKVTAQTDTGTVIENARVLLKASDGTGPFPFEDSITIVNAGTTATVTHTGHGMATNDKVDIDGASHWQNNGVHQITFISVNSYSYVMTSAPGSSPTGTIIATFVALSGLTDVNGEISISRVYGSAQPTTGWSRKSTSAPFLKEGSLAGTSISNATGLNATAVMVSDE